MIPKLRFHPAPGPLTPVCCCTGILLLLSALYVSSGLYATSVGVDSISPNHVYQMCHAEARVLCWCCVASRAQRAVRIGRVSTFFFFLFSDRACCFCDVRACRRIELNGWRLLEIGPEVSLLGLDIGRVWGGVREVLALGTFLPVRIRFRRF